ncbi:hypothetical protein HQQ94_00570 [Shewanella sp. VB17]|uniref:hypothetical protein n=1 Tax=Shewanella sp. VB17 TaxID=2739432 RepID=UPI0015639512|nr:hypothetical protein [Shewanella sp. VB17]NRD71769.1 hypothetical protein [Shewanella sp. VB17]
MPYNFYRGDTRTKAELVRAGGFKAWVPLTLTQAISLVNRFNNANTADVDLPCQAHRIKAQVNTSKKAKLLDLTRYVKVIKDRTSVQVSTDLTEECGGYTSGNIFKIQFDNLYAHDANTGIVTANPATLEVISHFGAQIITDTGNLATASIIAITSKGQEVYFLTAIPAKNIIGYKSGRGVWQ